MATVWDFETDPEYQAKLDWVEKFMVDELEPLDLVALDPYDKQNAEMMAILRPLHAILRPLQAIQSNEIH